MGQCTSCTEEDQEIQIEESQNASKDQYWKTPVNKLTKKFIPDDKKTEEALGDVEEQINPKRVQLAFSKKITEKYHKRKTVASIDDWIPSQKEEPESFQEYAESDYNKVSTESHTVYIQPLDTSMTKEFLSTCQKYCLAYFYPLPVVISKFRDITKSKIRNRKCLQGFVQYHSGDIMKRAKKWIPDDAYCMICILNMDLYPQDSWNFVYGQAYLWERTGVFSFARYNPEFYGEDHGMSGEELRELVMFRSIGTMVHEIGHMFGMGHCVYYECAMNGSMSAEEADKQPMQLCPICLRKLWHNIGFDPLERYQALVEASRVSSSFDETKGWYSKIVRHLKKIYAKEVLEEPFTKDYENNINETSTVKKQS
ncbi:unnamed protein product [Moneuplotes crassus]|uniref:Archaemetzincin-2 n=1 Tax=Euplotes crassus TaxID=5936 RepID=A0AAD2CWX8_EUPCR|nr:unnamed protein product [Moneuplotes crassus]